LPQGAKECAGGFLEHCLPDSSAGVSRKRGCRGIKFNPESIRGVVTTGGNRQIFDGSDNRLYGGNSDNGGLANVNHDHVGNHWNNQSFRP